MTTSILVDRNVPVEMRDGTILRADVYRPDDKGKYPVILTRTPYNKGLWEQSVWWDLVESINNGYARVVQDIRGRYASDGEWLRGPLYDVEVPDSKDTLDWLASQSWCDGNIGMMGASYMGNLQWVAAMADSPHLKAIAPEGSTSGPVFDTTLLGGPTYLSCLAYWCMLVGGDILDRLDKKGADVSKTRTLLNQAFANPEEIYDFLPLKDVPLFKSPELQENWRRLVLELNPKADPGLAASWPYEKIKIPVLNVSGWFDYCATGAFSNFFGMKRRGSSASVRKNQHIYMGPWKHMAQALDFQAELALGSESRAPGPRVTPGTILSTEAPISALHMGFFNKFLRGIDAKLPAITYFVMGKNEWRTSEEWPLPGTEWQRFFLHSKGHANTSSGDGWLSRREPGSEPTDIFVYDPQFPAPSTGGRLMQWGGIIAGPRDQCHVANRNDVLCYTTPELSRDTEITGEIQLHLFAATSAVDTDFTAQLVDIYPDGRAYNMADGIVRARHRNAYWKEEFVKPGEVIEYVINLAVTSRLFRKGHRIRIDISSSNFPGWERNMNTGHPVGEDAKGIRAMQAIYHARECASYVDLPVIP